MDTHNADLESLVSPHSFDGHGAVPQVVHEASKRIARLRMKFVNQWNPARTNPLTTREVDELFEAAAIQAEWMREMYEALHPSSNGSCGG